VRKKKTLSELREDCRKKKKMYDIKLKRCRGRKNTPKSWLPPPPPKRKTLAEIRAECKKKGLVYDPTIKDCRPSKSKSRRPVSRKKVVRKASHKQMFDGKGVTVHPSRKNSRKSRGEKKPLKKSKNLVWIGELGDIRETENGQLFGWATVDNTFTGDYLDFIPNAYQVMPPDAIDFPDVD
tara:strand:- start:882 stop:1421 length:540 start_codon:yes stop_codon:yes gene_type:complete